MSDRLYVGPCAETPPFLGWQDIAKSSEIIDELIVVDLDSHLLWLPNEVSNSRCLHLNGDTSGTCRFAPCDLVSYLSEEHRQSFERDYKDELVLLGSRTTVSLLLYYYRG